MKKTYMQGCGNSFFIADVSDFPLLSDADMETLYHRHNGRKVDGVLFLGSSDKAAVRMNYFDIGRSSGRLSRASTCGNGIRCIARFARDQGHADGDFNIETDNDIRAVSIGGDFVTVNMGKPENFMRLSEHDYYVHLGLPHYVRFTDHLDPARTLKEGAILRYDKGLLQRLGSPKDILQFNSARVDGEGDISILTREGGVEDMTLACGTGSTSSAYVSHVARSIRFPITVHNLGGDLLIDKTPDGQLLMKGPADYM